MAVYGRNNVELIKGAWGAYEYSDGAGWDWVSRLAEALEEAVMRIAELEDERDAALSRIAEVAAKAWDEGRRAEELAWEHAFDGHPVPEGEMCDECIVENPYLKVVE